MALKADHFAAHEYRDYIVYRELAVSESNPEFKRILNELAEQERSDYESWLALSEKKDFEIGWAEIRFAKILRSILGVSFIARFIKRREERRNHLLETMLTEAPSEWREHIQNTIDHERVNEAKLIHQIKDEKVEFIGSIILGLNDGLIELTGALVGFSFALQTSTLVALTGSITGIAASLSMAASAYMQARHEESGKDPKKAALYTGISYFIVVVLLIAPFLLLNTIALSLMTMFAIILVIITSISYYTAVIFDRSFRTQFLQMIFFSLGVSAIAFLIGSAFQRFTGLSA